MEANQRAEKVGQPDHWKPPLVSFRIKEKKNEETKTQKNKKRKWKKQQ